MTFLKNEQFPLQKKVTAVDYPDLMKRLGVCNRQGFKVLHWSLENMKHIFATASSVILGQTSAGKSAGLMLQVDKIRGN